MGVAAATAADRLRRSPFLLPVAWLAAHALAVAGIRARPFVLNDVYYYFRGLNGLQPGAMDEYPEIGVWPVRAVNLVAGSQESFTLGLVLLASAVSAVFTVLLWRYDPSRRAPWFWVVYIAVAGPVTVTRLDLFCGVAVAAGAALLFSRRSAATGAGAALLALATLMKLWPGMLAAGLVGGLRRAGTWIRVLSFTGALAVLSGVTALVAGPDRLLSPVTYQGDRGLQIESVAAAPVILADALAGPGDGRWDIRIAPSKSIEVFGPGVSAAVTLTTVLTGLVVVWALAWVLRRLVRDDWTPLHSLAFSMAVVMLVIVTNKVFSPQYVIWIAPLAAVALAAVGGRSGPGRDLTVARLLAGGVLLLAALTTLIFPYFYNHITLGESPAVAAALLLCTRGLVAVVLAVGCVWWAVSLTRRSAGTSASALSPAPGRPPAPHPPGSRSLPPATS